MTDLIELQKNFINKRFGTFIHFNSASVQFQTGPVIDWEYGCETMERPAAFRFCRWIGIRISWTARSGPKSPKAPAAVSRL